MRVTVIVFVLAVLVPVILAATYTSEIVNTGSFGSEYRFTWSQGCPDLSAGPNQCEPGRPDGSSRFCRLDSDGTSSSSNYAYKCGESGDYCSCNNEGGNDYECQTEGVLSFEGCTRCTDLCEEPDYCDDEYDCVSPSEGLCSGEAECVCHLDRCSDKSTGCVDGTQTTCECTTDRTECRCTTSSCGGNGAVETCTGECRGACWMGESRDGRCSLDESRWCCVPDDDPVDPDPSDPDCWEETDCDLCTREVYEVCDDGSKTLEWSETCSLECCGPDPRMIDPIAC